MEAHAAAAEHTAERCTQGTLQPALRADEEEVAEEEVARNWAPVAGRILPFARREKSQWAVVRQRARHGRAR